jgi:hypothetical protein
MFRDTLKSEKDPTHFGIGSTITGEGNEAFLVICTGVNCVSLLDWGTFKVKGPSIAVEDVNFLTENETRTLVSASLPWTISDYTLSPKGMK